MYGLTYSLYHPEGWFDLEKLNFPSQKSPNGQLREVVNLERCSIYRDNQIVLIKVTEIQDRINSQLRAVVDL